MSNAAASVDLGGGGGDGVILRSGVSLVARPLYGGAISLGVPARFDDISAFRQVPDHQEVFSDPRSDQSVIVELLSCERLEEPGETPALRHWKQLLIDNKAAGYTLEDAGSMRDTSVWQQTVPGTRQLTVCSGVQRVSKFKEDISEAANDVRVYLACFRMADVGTDAIVSFNSPVFVSAASSSAKQVSQQDMASHAATEVAAALFENIIASFEVKNWGLFL